MYSCKPAWQSNMKPHPYNFGGQIKDLSRLQVSFQRQIKMVKFDSSKYRPILGGICMCLGFQVGSSQHAQAGGLFARVNKNQGSVWVSVPRAALLKAKELWKLRWYPVVTNFHKGVS